MTVVVFVGKSGHVYTRIIESWREFFNDRDLGFWCENASWRIEFVYVEKD